jgi:hypothetical protein
VDALDNARLHAPALRVGHVGAPTCGSPLSGAAEQEERKSTVVRRGLAEAWAEYVGRDPRSEDPLRHDQDELTRNSNVLLRGGACLINQMPLHRDHRAATKERMS